MKIEERSKMTFPKLWETLTVKEAATVRANIISGLRKTPATFWRWYRGDAVPESYAERAMFAEIINKTLGISTDADTLFPERR